MFKTVLLLDEREILGRELLPVECQQDSMVYYTPERLYQVTNQRFPLEPQAVVDANVQVEPEHAYKDLHEIEQHRIANIQRDVHHVVPHPRVPSFPIKILEICREKRLRHSPLQPHKMAVVRNIVQSVERSVARVDSLDCHGVFPASLEAPPSG